ncbi:MULTISPECIES: cysteine--tRNA ligase [Kitasatospora]|uniref:Cysteine--tRNA ligase n=1 Tax=Kitasatospora setae (strain ATCC 33774 / DSM 43861 / JCM 3304 / KCC A-0304 / NBRC 14216 / KM-6054) TaxID=452652 RepID=E4NEQ3_KITSK|nr:MULTISPECIES: cysteine--tRNA ligase [Kitasatospora]BAJ29839.1 putative cysteinyl-tRNA synthetase [Kitasatospora setae KM-6054]
MAIRLHNTLTKRKEEFVTMTPGVVRMFVCGPTVYGLSHVGHAKTYTQFDLVARYLKKRGYQVTYAQNLTDVDDKIIRRANELGMDPRDLATEYEKHYLDDMAALHNTNVDVFGRAHDHIDEIVAQVQQLIERGHAYRLDDGWYYDLTTFPGYGKLSGRTEVKAEDSLARVDENDQKRNPGDFALWKARKPGEPYWATALGEGRPGWHIEDTAITEALFGPQYDLHGGAVDLIFPHHEAEIAQMEAASGLDPLARYWMHTGLLRVDGAKMSKSTGNFLTIRDILKTADFRTLRYAFLSQHYRSSMELNDTTLEQARAARRRVENFARLIDRNHEDSPASAALARNAREAIFERLDDDLDTPGALAVLFDYIREQNRREEPPGTAALALLRELDELFDAFDLDDRTTDDAEIEALLARRRELRQARRFEEADEIRKTLHQRGIVIEDTPDTTRWWFTEEVTSV